MLIFRIYDVFAQSGPNGPPPKSARVATVRKYGVLPIKLALEAQNEHLAAEVCRVTVSSVRFDCYLQQLRAGHFENEQKAAEGRRVTVHICSFLVYLQCFSTSRSIVFLQ